MLLREGGGWDEGRGKGGGAGGGGGGGGAHGRGMVGEFRACTPETRENIHTLVGADGGVYEEEDGGGR